MQPVIPDIGALSSVSVAHIVFALLGSLVLSFIIALVYRNTHRGLSYSQSFQFSLVLLSMLGAAVMIVASNSLLAAVGILGAFSLIRFRTAVKDPKDMAYILFVLVIGLSMGAQMYMVGVITALIVCAVILGLTWMDFGMTSKHESIIRLMCKGEKDSAVNTAHYEVALGKMSESFHLLSAHAHGDRMELTYGVRPRKGSTSLTILEALRKEDGIEDAELFDAKHQVEF
ncbi:MAG: DUF4956 domain-containing protein [Candidatus Peregrinibacteria bacterium]|nr:DUF4956 domain-containing protein [Candidatus Peregrinibacteria bacterium]